MYHQRVFLMGKDVVDERPLSVAERRQLSAPVGPYIGQPLVAAYFHANASSLEHLGTAPQDYHTFFVEFRIIDTSETIREALKKATKEGAGKTERDASPRYEVSTRAKETIEKAYPVESLDITFNGDGREVTLRPSSTMTLSSKESAGVRYMFGTVDIPPEVDSIVVTPRFAGTVSPDTPLSYTMYRNEYHKRSFWLFFE